MYLLATTQEMMSAIALNPVSVAIEADQKNFNYILQEYLLENVELILITVFLLLDMEQKMVKIIIEVKNSWSSWGDNGFIKLDVGQKYTTDKDMWNFVTSKLSCSINI